MRDRDTCARRRAARYLLVVAISVVAATTLLPAEPASQVDWRQVLCVVCVRGWLADGLSNLALFLPLGVALDLLGFRPRRALLLATGLSLSVEIAQLAIPGRDPSISDVLANTLGAAVGGAFVRLTPLWASPNAHGAGRLSLVAAAVAGATLASTDVLLTTSLPGRTYWGGSGRLQTSGQPLRLGGNTEPHGSFAGRIDEVRIYRRARVPSEIQADMNTPVASTEAPPELVAAYNFDEGSGSRLVDVSGNGNAGSVLGATWTRQGKFGSALEFDGVRDVVLVPHRPSLDLSTGMTLEAWIYPTAVQEGRRAVLQKEFDMYFLLASSKAGALGPGGGGTFGLLTEIIAAPATVPTNVWTHVAVTYDGSLLQLFINGRLVTGRLRWYPGRVTEVTVDGLPIPAGIATESPQLRARLLAGAPLRIHAVAAMAAVATPLPLVTLHDDWRNEILFLAVDGDDVVFRLGTRASAMALDSPALRARGVMQGILPGGDVTLTVYRSGGSYCLDVNTHATCGLRFSVGAGWALLAYSRVPSGWPHPTLNVVWMAVLLFPFGFWLRLRWESLLGGFVLATGIVLPCTLGGLSVSPWEVVGATAGLLGGWACARATQHLRGAMQNR